jgi:hypothetical protein
LRLVNLIFFADVTYCVFSLSPPPHNKYTVFLAASVATYPSEIGYSALQIVTRLKKEENKKSVRRRERDGRDGREGNEGGG